MSEATGAPFDDDQLHAAVRERIYASITGLATVVTLLQYAGETSPASAAASLLATMAGLFAASVVADLIAHSTVHGDSLTRASRRRIVGVAGQALEIAVLPVLLILLTSTGLWPLRTGLVLAAVTLGVTQLALVVWGLRRSRVPWHRRLLFLMLEAVAIGAVIAIKLVAH